MLAAAEGIIFREHVSVGRYRSPSGVNLKLCDCASEYETLLGDTEVLKSAIRGQKCAASKEDL